MNLKFRPLIGNQRILVDLPTRSSGAVTNVMLGGLVLGAYSVISYGFCAINQTCMVL